jgi:hypothetical protein
MKKIGTTQAGSIIVEMALDEYHALTKLHAPVETRPPVSTRGDCPPGPMTSSERVAYVAERLKKLRPKRRDGVIRSIEAMFQFTGGIAAADVDATVKALVKSGFLAIDPLGRVSYE